MYDRYFGFQESPFSVTPDPHFFYDNPVYLEAYACLRYGIAAKKGFIAITGEVGTGKTTLLRKLMHEFESTVRFASIFNTLITFSDLLRVALRDLGVPTKEKDRLALIDELNAYLVEQFKRGHIVCLLIDEAQNLSEESLEGLRLLSNLETNKQKLLQIVLIGQPELNAKLDKPTLRQLKQRIAVQCAIVPLNEEEVGSYINRRLEVAGHRGKDLFEVEAIQEIARYAKGIPRLINILCDNALLIAFAASQKAVSAKMIREAASDLKLRSEAHQSDAKNTLTAVPLVPDRELLERQAKNRERQRNLSRSSKIRIGLLLGILILFITVFLRDAEKFFTGRQFKNDATQKVSLGAQPKILPESTDEKVGITELGEPQETDQQSVSPELTNTEAGIIWKNRVIIPYGSTVYEIAYDTYGTNAVLGLDLIEELNPQIPNLNRVSAGQELLLPPLTPETLVRRQPDDSYRLVVGSFRGRTEAEQSGGRISKAGFRVVLTPRMVSDDILLYRLEIEGLRNFEEAKQILQSGLKSAWFTSDDTAGSPLGSTTSRRSFLPERENAMQVNRRD